MKDLKTLLETKNNFSGPGTFGELETPQSPLTYGFMMYDENSGMVLGVQAKNADQLADAYSVDSEEIYDKVFELKVGESVNLKDQGIWCRIW